ncbi:MAG: hypothetical protein FWJ92_11890 [Actinomycetes bacterium]|jgi:hypothetical protein|nr:hypothetical protein [Acidimicrobiia bacterium]
MRRAAVAVVAAAAVFGLPSPASADSARPSNYRSEVVAVEPENEAVWGEVAGGDAFLRLRVEPGVTVEVPGYEDEPYLRIHPDGTVEVNRNSPTHWLNEDRYGGRAIPPAASAEAPPDWASVGHGGSYGWHDHRIHWMSPEPPPAVAGAGPSEIFEWVVPIAVDGRPAEIRGTLHWLPNIDPVPWVALAVATATAAWLRPSMLLLAGAAAASVVGFGQVAGSPLGPGDEWLAWAPPMVVLSILAWATIRKGGALIFGIGAAVLVGWAASRIGALWLPSLPTALPPVIERAATALAAGAGLGGAVAAYRRIQPSADG